MSVSRSPGSMAMVEANQGKRPLQAGAKVGPLRGGILYRPRGDPARTGGATAFNFPFLWGFGIVRLSLLRLADKGNQRHAILTQPACVWGLLDYALQFKVDEM